MCPSLIQFPVQGRKQLELEEGALVHSYNNTGALTESHSDQVRYNFALLRLVMWLPSGATMAGLKNILDANCFLEF